MTTLKTLIELNPVFVIVGALCSLWSLQSFEKYFLLILCIFYKKFNTQIHNTTKIELNPFFVIVGALCSLWSLQSFEKYFLLILCIFYKKFNTQIHNTTKIELNPFFVIVGALWSLQSFKSYLHTVSIIGCRWTFFLVNLTNTLIIAITWKIMLKEFLQIFWESCLPL